MELFSTIDWKAVATSVTSSLIVASVTALFGAFFIKKYISQLNFSTKMKSYGFLNSSTQAITKREIAKIFSKASTVKMFYVSGTHFLKDNLEAIKRGLERNDTSIKLLCSDPNSLFLTDIEKMERYHNYRKLDSSISEEIYEIIELFKDRKLEIRFYSTEYRLPYILAYFNNKEGRKIVKAWLTMTLPPYKSIKSFVLRGEKRDSKIYEDEFNFIDMMEVNFDTIWEQSKTTEEVLALK